MSVIFEKKSTLKVSSGTQWITVPDTTNMAQDDAVTTLKNLGLTVVVNPIQDDTVASGTVVRTDPAANEQMAGGTTVTVYVAQPKINTEKQVPSVVGLQQAEGISAIRNSNLIPSVEEQPNEQPAGTIISQSPTAGSNVRMNSTVKLYVSTGVSQAVLDQQAADAAAAAAASSAATNGWYEQDENGNWYHVNPDGTRDG